MTTQGLLSGKSRYGSFCGIFSIFDRYRTLHHMEGKKRDAGEGRSAGAPVQVAVMVMTYIASCVSVWVFFAGPGAYYRYGLGYFFSGCASTPMFPIICYFTMTKGMAGQPAEALHTTRRISSSAATKSKALTVIIDIVYIICAVPFISAVLVAGGRAAEVATGGAVSSQTFTLICGIIATVFVMLGGVKSTALADAVQGWFFILALWANYFRNAQDRIQRLDHRGHSRPSA